jgi:ATP-grasp ribosomal peptide maturase
MTVLVLTNEEDVTADLVIAALQERGTQLVRFDPAAITDGSTLSFEYARGRSRGYLAAGERVLSLDDLSAVWVRRPGEPGARATRPSAWLTADCEQAFYGMLECASVGWMNHPQAAARARRKPWQLQHAHDSGFSVPATVVTTYPDIARQFVGEYRRVVVKKMSSTPLADGMTLPTTIVPPNADFDEVAAGPTLLQRYILRRADIRLTAVGAEIFAARKESDPEQTDGRFGDHGHRWQPVEVSAQVERAVHTYLRGAGLAYGAFDFAEDLEGRWWFLECNQGGQFGFVELATGQPVADALARWLGAHEREHAASL